MKRKSLLHNPSKKPIHCRQGTIRFSDDKDNPSISDIYTAIRSALNGPPQEVAPSEPPKPWYAVQDVFPVDFPNGHCVFVEYLRGREDSPSYRQKYKYADGKVTMQGERIEVVVAYRKKDATIITKPETTDNYHRIPVDDGDHDGHRIRTITVSAGKGIKALFCGTCKKIITYLFDVDKFTMAEARAWIEEHKDYKFEQSKTFQAELAEGYKANAELNKKITEEWDEAETKEAPDYTALFALLNGRLDTLAQAIEALKPKPAPIVEPVKDDITIDPPAQVIDIEPTPAPAPKAAPKSDELTMDEIESAITSGVAKLDLSKVLPETIALALDRLRGRVR